jgi:hypothetical protein
LSGGPAAAAPAASGLNRAPAVDGYRDIRVTLNGITTRTTSQSGS